MDAKVISDRESVTFLFESLIDEALAVRERRGERLQTRKDNEYIRFLLRIPDAEECDGAEPVLLYRTPSSYMTTGEKKRS